MFESIKTMLINLFDERYVIVVVVTNVVVTIVVKATATTAIVATRPHRGDSMSIRNSTT